MDAGGFIWDLGGHVVFSRSGEFDRLLQELFAPGELLHHDRSSFVSFRDRWVPYLFQQHLRSLPTADAQTCLTGLLLAARGGQPQPRGGGLRPWLHPMYGAPLVERFFGPHNRKVWATSPEEMSSRWVAERVAPASRALRQQHGDLAVMLDVGG